MWEWKTQDGTVRQFNACSNDKKCPICGQFFKKGEKGCAIVPPMEIRKGYKKLAQNLVVHLDEWTAFCKGVTTDIDLAEKFAKHRVPRKKEFTSEEQKKIDAFRSACHRNGFHEDYDKPFGIKCKQGGSSIYLTYNVYADTIDLDYKGKCGLFDGFYTRQIIANVYNKMHEILGDNKHDDYSASKTINSVFEETTKIMKQIG